MSLAQRDFLGRRSALRLSAVVAVILAVGGCASKPSETNSSAAQSAPRFTAPREVTNPYLPLAGLHQDILESQSLRIERTVKHDLHKSFVIGGQTVDALVVEDREFESGRLKEVALDYNAQDDAGWVYYLGEDVDEYDASGVGCVMEVEDEGAVTLRSHQVRMAAR